MRSPTLYTSRCRSNSMKNPSNFPMAVTWEVEFWGKYCWKGINSQTNADIRRPSKAINREMICYNVWHIYFYSKFVAYATSKWKSTVFMVILAHSLYKCIPLSVKMMYEVDQYILVHLHYICNMYGDIRRYVKRHLARSRPNVLSNGSHHTHLISCHRGSLFSARRGSSSSGHLQESRKYTERQKKL